MVGASAVALQAATLLLRSARFAAPSAACAAVVIIGSSLAALRSRKVNYWFGRAGLVGGIAVLGVGMAEGASGWALAGTEIYASVLGFMIWVVVTATYLLRP
jgi:cobalamin biosynthesis protein CobD/CbiB